MLQCPSECHQTIADPVAAAKDAGLRYVNDRMPGITRKRFGRAFSYRDASGNNVTDPASPERIRKLAIPPARRSVWICASANGPLQATGTDARSRKQYRYHQRWHAVRDETKYSRMIAFGRALPAIRGQVERDLALRGLPRRKMPATVVRLPETTLIRVGNREYARENASHGLTTLGNRHVKVEGDTIHFEFRAKSGKLPGLSAEEAAVPALMKRRLRGRGRP